VLVQRVLAASKECAKLFGKWYRTLLLFLITVTVAISIRASEDKPNEFLPLQLATIYAAVRAGCMLGFSVSSVS
jgi:hypothetical protein